MEPSVVPYMSPQEEEPVQPPAGVFLQQAMHVSYLHIDGDSFFPHSGAFPLELIEVH
jgi:hypothetical protein